MVRSAIPLTRPLELPFSNIFCFNELRRGCALARHPVEVIVNGLPVARKTMVADGKIRELDFEVPIRKSSWIAVRILASSHTNPVFAMVDGKPVRASRASVQWCLDAVSQCWSQKAPLIRPAERDEALKVYDQAREVYRQRLAESVD